MYKKASVVLGALALVAIASQGFVASPAEAAKKVKYCVWHEEGTSEDGVLVTSKDVGDPADWMVIPAGATGSLARHEDHGDTMYQAAPPDFDCSGLAVP